MTTPPPIDISTLGPLYHDYSILGATNEQLPGIFAANQRAKAPVITGYIAFAIGKCSDGRTPPSFTELFCADGFYAMVATRLGCTPSMGIDSGKDDFFSQAPLIAEALGIKPITFLKEEIGAHSSFRQSDIVANIGGLYHVDDPEGVLRMSYRMTRRFLIVQTVVSVANDNEDYFERPAPGWTWGNRYNRRSFDRLVRSTCPGIIDAHFNILKGNGRPEDLGSSYYLIDTTVAEADYAASSTSSA